MKKTIGMIFLALLVTMTMAIHQAEARGIIDGPVIYVTGQGLFYDSIVIANELPMRGPFQKLEMAGPTGLQTEFGLGDQGYVGGRWWVDVNGNDEMDEGDSFFSCPLLGPGRAEQ
jgi:hypothetical protein